ncbi:MAG: DUF58 domain-containing protein [Alphaproteobacteria bacterium]|nr:DUF58 domain-containing protein [Alphaproteobacteria bacterium]
MGLTPDELQQIRRLHLQAGRAVDSPFAGEYKSAFKGRGMEFEEVRPYVPGDDVRHIDWNVTARTGEPFVKEYREERELVILLVVDVSGSVHFGGGGLDGETDKRRQLARVAGGLAFAGIRNGDRVGLLTFTDRIERSVPPRKSRGHAWMVIRSVFEDVPSGRGTALPLALEHAARVLKRRAVVCVLSDFMHPGSMEPVQRTMRVLSHRHQVHAFVVHDPLERQLPRVGLVELEDAETGTVRLVDAAGTAVGRPVGDRVRALQRAGARVCEIPTDRDAFHQLHQHFRRHAGAR